MKITQTYNLGLIYLSKNGPNDENIDVKVIRSGKMKNI